MVQFTNQLPEYSKYEIGDGTYGNPKVLWSEQANLVIGKYCSIAEGVIITLGGNHRVDWVTTYPFSDIHPEARGFRGHPQSKGDVVIGHDVWIGRDSLILSGVTIGNGAVVGAGSVVTKDVAPYEIVAGNPARHLRFRFSPDTVARLQEIEWWYWPFEKIVQAWPMMLTENIQGFLDTYQ